MHKLWSVVIVVATIVSTAATFAADIPVKVAKASAAAPLIAQYNWTGFYFGIAGGGGWGNSMHSTPRIPVDFSGTFDVDGGLIGGTAGFNWQNGPVVFGIEADFSASSIEGSTRGAKFPFCPPGGALANCQTELEWLATLRARVGPAWGAFLPFATAGVAFGDVEGRANGNNAGSDRRVGWTAGGGLEVALTPNCSLKAEYLFVDLGTANNLFVRQPGSFPFNVSFETHILRAGVNFKF